MPERNPYLTGAGTLLNAAEARIDRRKLEAYALNPDHPSGRHKAAVFERVLGYHASKADELVAVIRRGIRRTAAQLRLMDTRGTLIVVDLLVTGPTGRSATIRTGWISYPGNQFST